VSWQRVVPSEAWPRREERFLHRPILKGFCAEDVGGRLNRGARGVTLREEKLAEGYWDAATVAVVVGTEGSGVDRVFFDRRL